MAIAAVDIALWDLKARLLGLPLVKLLGQVREWRAGVRQRRIYLVFRRAVCDQLEGWVPTGIRG